MSAKVFALKAGLRIMQASGVPHLLRGRLQGWGSIFCLHHVCPGGGRQTGFAPNSKLEVTPEFLRDLIALARKRGFEPASLGDLVQHLESNQKPPKPLAVFTLDDGYKDNFHFARPVFEAAGCPYTIFVAPSIADGTCNLWWRSLEFVIANTEHLKAEVGERSFALACKTVAEKERAYGILFLQLARMSEMEQRRAIDLLAKQYGHDPVAYCREVAMGWDMLREIAVDPLCTIGAHTINHYSVARLSAEQALSEMEDSRLRIEQELGRKVEFFAYPYGDRPAVGMRDFKLATEAGFRASVTTRKGVVTENEAHHLQSLPRIMISGRYQELNFVDALISGLPTALLGTLKPVQRD